MVAYHLPWWLALIGALTPPGFAVTFGLGYWWGRRSERGRSDHTANGRERTLYRPRG
jgi:hypothetical protein